MAYVIIQRGVSDKRTGEIAKIITGTARTGVLSTPINPHESALPPHTLRFKDPDNPRARQILELVQQQSTLPTEIVPEEEVI